MYSALDISNFFILKGNVSPLKLQKLLYYSQIWYYVKHNRKLFSDDIGAWVYGPAIYNVWLNFKFMKRSNDIPQSRASQVTYNRDILTHLEDVWSSYGYLTGSELVDLTHNEKPWKISRQGYLNDQPSDQLISIDSYTTADYKLTIDKKIPIPNTILDGSGSFNNRL